MAIKDVVLYIAGTVATFFLLQILYDFYLKNHLEKFLKKHKDFFSIFWIIIILIVTIIIAIFSTALLVVVK